MSQDMQSNLRLKITHKKKDLVDISLNIRTSLALVGQSGSGKSLTLKALLNMLPQDMTMKLEEDFGFELINGKTTAFVPQNPFTSLSPLTKIRKQFFSSENRILTLLDSVGLDKVLLDRFPPELSGGQLQRIVIAMALEKKPKLLLLDEPTTALDPVSKELIIGLLRDIQKKEAFKMLYVTHDISSIKNLCEDIVIIKNGYVVESGLLLDILKNPKEKYTKTLIESNFSNRNYRE